MLVCRTRAPPPALQLSAPGLCLRRLLRPCGLCLLRLPTPNGLWTTGLSIRAANPPSRLLLPAFGLRLAPLWCRPLSPASASPLSLKRGLRLTSTCRVFRSRWMPLRTPILPVPSETVLNCFGLRLRSLARPFRTRLPARPSCTWLAPCALGPSVQLAFASAFGLRLWLLLRLRRGLDWLFELSACACCSCLSGPFESNRRSTAWSSIAENLRPAQSVYASAKSMKSVDNLKAVLMHRKWCKPSVHAGLSDAQILLQLVRASLTACSLSLFLTTLAAAEPAATCLFV